MGGNRWNVPNGCQLNKQGVEFCRTRFALWTEYVFLLECFAYGRNICVMLVILI